MKTPARICRRLLKKKKKKKRLSRKSTPSLSHTWAELALRPAVLLVGTAVRQREVEWAGAGTLASARRTESGAREFVEAGVKSSGSEGPAPGGSLPEGSGGAEQRFYRLLLRCAAEESGVRQARPATFRGRPSGAAARARAGGLGPPPPALPGAVVPRLTEAAAAHGDPGRPGDRSRGPR